MNYSTLLSEAKEKISGFVEYYNKALEKKNIYLNSGLHIVFSNAFVPMLEEALEFGREDAVEEMSSFLEEMETCEDPKVAEVCEFTVLEKLCDNHKDDELRTFLKPETLLALRSIREYMPE